MPTSGTVAQFRYTVQQVCDHAFRRATGLGAARLSGEGQIIARETLFTMLSEMVNVAMPLWTQEFDLLSVATGSADVQTPDGTVDIIHAYWRTLQPWRGPAADGSGTDVAALFGGVPNPDVTITGPNPAVTVNFNAVQTIDTIGVIWGGSVGATAALSLWGSADGDTFTRITTLPSTTFVPGQWSYFEINPVATAQYMRLQYDVTGSWVLNQLNFCSNSQDIEMGMISIDDYYNLPNKQFTGGQAVQCYIERNTLSPTLKIWPVPNIHGFYNGTVTSVMRRYIQDPGAFSDTLELPKRWYEYVIWSLAAKLVYELPDDSTGLADFPAALRVQEKTRRSAAASAEAAKAATLAWAEERTPGSIRMVPNLSCYSK